MNTVFECWMASDIAQALERDNVLGDSDKPDRLAVRKPGEGEKIPSFLREGANVTDWETEFMLVHLGYGAPNENNNQFNVLTRYDYPVMNRYGQKPTKSDFKQFI